MSMSEQPIAHFYF
jgi:hypothetical protein